VIYYNYGIAIAKGQTKLKLHYLRQGGYVFITVCLSVSNFAQKTSQRICMKFSGKVGNGPINKWLNFGDDPNHGSRLQQW